MSALADFALALQRSRIANAELTRLLGQNPDGPLALQRLQRALELRERQLKEMQADRMRLWERIGDLRSQLAASGHSKAQLVVEMREQRDVALQQVEEMLPYAKQLDLIRRVLDGRDDV